MSRETGETTEGRSARTGESARRALREDEAGSKPILCVDVDGVISLFGWDGPLESAPGEFHLIEGVPHCISREAGGRLRRLEPSFELVWATGWEERANQHLPHLLGIGDLPTLSFDGRARFGTTHWKLEAIEEYATQRPLAWIDDALEGQCFEWAEARSAPTLLVPTDSARGIEEAHVEALLRWAAALATTQR